MGHCKILEVCPLLAQGFPRDPSRAKSLEKDFCRGSKPCARLKAFQELGPGRVPRDVYPDDYRKVIGLLTQR